MVALPIHVICIQSPMPTAIAYVYMSGWMSFCLAAIVVIWQNRADCTLFRPIYLRTLLVPWKLVLFAIALVFFIVAAPYAGDPTWDEVDATFMAVLTYVSAPWSVGTLYRWARGRERRQMAFVALGVWLFSASFSYDLYIFLRHGHYPSSWWSNVVASSVLYSSAGLLWSLEVRAERGVVFSFMVDPWLEAESKPRATMAIVGYAFVFVILVVGMMLPFVWEPLRQWFVGG